MVERRQVLVTMLSVPVLFFSGCNRLGGNTDNGNNEESKTPTSTSTSTETPVSEPEYVPRLDIINYSDVRAIVVFKATGSPADTEQKTPVNGREFFNHTLPPNSDEFHLREERQNNPFILEIRVGGDVILQEYLEPYEGITISIYSKSDVEVSRSEV